MTDTNATPSNHTTQDNQAAKPDDLFNSLTLTECEEHFSKYYENEVFSDAREERLSLLRSSVELLERLEGTPFSHFAGRLLVFVAKKLPLFDQSGINIRSDFNLKVIKPKAINVRSTERDNMEEGETVSDSEETNNHEDNEKLFERFWKIQSILGNPNLLYDKNIWLTFRSNVDIILYHMEKLPATLHVWNLKRDYMTCSKALALQIKDVNMRRCFLLQILIVLQYLELPVESRPENFILDKSQMTWSAATTRKIFDLIQDTTNKNEGTNFLQFIQHILRNETLWNEWKNKKCKEPVQPEEDIVNMRGTYHKRRKMSDELNSAKAYKLQVIGSQDMTRLWNKNQEKFSKPNLGMYINKQSEQIKDPNHIFRVLRMGRKNRHFFRQTGAPIAPIEDYLKEFVSRVLN